MNQFWLFENINLFDILCPHKINEYSNHHTFLDYKKGDYIYLEDDIAKNFFLISKGKVKIGFWDENGEETIIAYLKKGDIFGESALLNQPRRKEFAQAAENNTELCPVNITQAEDLIKENKNFSISFYKFIGFKFRKIERRYQIMLFRNTKTRIIEFIKELKDEDLNPSHTGNNELLIHNPYSQSEIAKLIGTSRPTFNILLKDFKNQEYFIWQKNKILLKSKFMLEF
ncbi:MAG: Crp/Fnr family transcriptional regulator [Limnohabitans sp.]|nr:Crp/Fnr family transcriptional regulator [Limnohabitans sp.]